MELDYSKIGRNIRVYRQKKGLKQKKLAELIDVSDQHISHIENGHTKLSLGTLVAIANVLQVDCNTLLGSTLSEVQNTVLQQKLDELSRNLDSSKLGLLVEFGKILSDYEMK